MPVELSMIKCLCVPSKTGMEGGLDQGQILSMLSRNLIQEMLSLQRADNSNNIGLLLNFIFSRTKNVRNFI